MLEGCPGRLSGRERHEILRLAAGDRRAPIALPDAVLHGTRRADGSRIPDTTRIHAGDA